MAFNVPLPGGAYFQGGYAPPYSGAPAPLPLDAQLTQLQLQLRGIEAQLNALLAGLSQPGVVASPAPAVPPPAVAPAAWSSPLDVARRFIAWMSGWIPAPAVQPVPTPPVVQPAPAPPRAMTDFVISSFNVLGSSHTRPGGNKPGMASGVARIRSAAQLLEKHDVDVVGFQEFQGDQLKEFLRVAGKKYAVYPGVQLGKREVVNSIAWRKDTWEMVKPGHIEIPYFGGQKRKMPVVRLRHKVTGQEAYFANFHNPASTKSHPNQQHWRDLATAKEIDLANRLMRETGLPVFITGDMNEREEYYDRLTRATPMVAANEGPGGRAPRKMAIDWIFGSPGVRFSGYTVDRGAQVKRTTDHPMIVSRARIGPGVG